MEPHHEKQEFEGSGGGKIEPKMEVSVFSCVLCHSVVNIWCCAAAECHREVTSSPFLPFCLRFFCVLQINVSFSGFFSFHFSYNMKLPKPDNSSDKSGYNNLNHVLTFAD